MPHSRGERGGGGGRSSSGFDKSKVSRSGGRGGRGRGRGRGGRGGRGGRRGGGEEDMMKTLKKEIREFTAASLDKRGKARYRQDRLVELGAQKPKGLKTPFKMLIGLRKAEAHREDIRGRRSEEALGYNAVKAKKIREKKVQEEIDAVNQLRGNRRGDANTVGDGTFGFTHTVGSMRRGMLTLSARDIAGVVGNPNKPRQGPKKPPSSKKGYNRKGGFNQKKKSQMNKKRR
eukprot:TRINITY_DN284_c3_g1_i1.p1 TRINITY_DN284_c3_g1~~TRINITY_DN284_c3_g1_i1.p1  ORF type:complete len:231 (+),score=53.35 TRINITY_DN284_c3_g1_i1:939-1631(+)